MGCYTNCPADYVHLMIHSTNPSIIKRKKMEAPLNWNPKVAPKVVCNSMNPFVYKPLQLMAVKNVGGVVNMMREEKNGKEPYFG